MKYYGFIYEGNIEKYNATLTEGFDTPFDALAEANKKWDSYPEFQIARLLVVLKDDESLNNYAYFQFTSSSACKKFLSGKENIVWSNPSEQIWNGDSTMMK